MFSGATTIKTKKRPRTVPQGLSQNDENVLKQVMRRAYHLDMQFNIFGYRVGWNGVVGIIPVVGDIFGVICSLMLFKSSLDVDGGLPLIVQAKFLFNILLDFLIGLIPILGNFVEVMYKANSRNALILEKHLEEKGRANILKVSLNLIPQAQDGTSSSLTDVGSVKSKSPSTVKTRNVARRGSTSSINSTSSPPIYSVGKDPERFNYAKSRNLDL